MKPSTPAAMNADCQPQAAAMNGMVAGATRAPTFAPELNRVVANTRSPEVNQLVTVLMLAGKLPPSPSPRMMRLRPMDLTPTAKAWEMAPTLHQMMEMAKPMRAPYLSIIQPNMVRPMA